MPKEQIRNLLRPDFASPEQIRGEKNDKNKWQNALTHFQKIYKIYKRLNDEGKTTGDDAAKAIEVDRVD